ncbi:hypothetical protein ACVWXN_003428 [Bradyrhizobium sp. i1.4.4]
MKGRGIPYSQAEMDWLEANRAMVLSDYHNAFVAQFERADVSAANLHGLRKRKGWKVGRAPGRLAGRKQGRRMAVSDAELAWLKDNCTKPIADYHRDFCTKFARVDLSAEQLHSLRKREGWRTGRTGRFDKGHVPWTQGKKLPFNANTARTQFKKGQLPQNTKHDGHERIDSQRGIALVRVSEPNPYTGGASRYLPKHYVLWREKHGPLAKGMALKCKGDPTNPDPSNWEAVSRGVLPRLNGQKGRRYDQAPDELKPTIMAVAKLEQAVFEKRKGARRG